MSLVHALLGPFSVKASVTDKNHAQNPVSVTVDTSYPFSDSLVQSSTQSDVCSPLPPRAIGIGWALHSRRPAPEPRAVRPSTGSVDSDRRRARLGPAARGPIRRAGARGPAAVSAVLQEDDCVGCGTDKLGRGRSLFCCLVLVFSIVTATYVTVSVLVLYVFLMHSGFCLMYLVRSEGWEVR